MSKMETVEVGRERDDDSDYAKEAAIHVVMGWTASSGYGTAPGLREAIAQVVDVAIDVARHGHLWSVWVVRSSDGPYARTFEPGEDTPVRGGRLLLRTEDQEEAKTAAKNWTGLR